MKLPKRYLSCARLLFIETYSYFYQFRTTEKTRILQEEFGFRTKSTRRSGRTTYSGTDYSDESLMLTGDLNVADVEWVVHYKIADPFKYLFQISHNKFSRR